MQNSTAEPFQTECQVVADRLTQAALADMAAKGAHFYADAAEDLSLILQLAWNRGRLCALAEKAEQAIAERAAARRS